MNLSVTRL